MIHDIHQLSAVNNSYIGLSDSDYYENTYGVFMNNSSLQFSDANIYDNMSTGVYMYYSGTIENMFTNTNIYGNVGNGIELRNTVCKVIATDIYDNGLDGYRSISTAPSLFTTNNNIYNNGGPEIRTLYSSFPERYPTLQPTANVYDTNNSSNNHDQYVLMTLGAIPEQIDVSSWAFPGLDYDRVFPTADAYYFGEREQTEAGLIYYEAIIEMDNENYNQAYNLLKSLIQDYPNESITPKAVSLLPYIDKAQNSDNKPLMAYLEELEENDNLEFAKLQAQSVILIESKQYEAAISMLTKVMDKAPSDENELIAQLDIAYCEYQNIIGAARSIGSGERNRAFAKYSEVERDVTNKIFAIREDLGESEAPFVEALKATNYPNPFNPVTTIQYDIPEQTSVSIDIYNVLGQKVKCLLNENKSSGRYQEVWNGENETGEKVGSGVYFYKITTKAKTLTQKMLLLK